VKHKAAITLLLALALMIGIRAETFGQKAKKVKEKRYELVVHQNLKDYEGTYIGIEPDYVVEIQVAADGRLKLTSLEDGRSVRFTNVKVDGARLTADKIYANGSSGKLDATFRNCILNGKTFFGILVDGLDIHLDGGVTLNTVFYRRK
jgi:hypothetical protein